jgi:tetratricopeptide (TPR) repeat protein
VLLGFSSIFEAKPRPSLIWIFAADSGNKLFGLPGFDKEILHHADFSRDGRYLLTVSTDAANKDPVRLWDAASGRFLHTLTRDGGDRRPRPRTSWSSDSRRVFVFTDGQGRFFDPATGERVARLPMDLKGHFDPCFSCDGDRLLTHQVGQAVLWNARTGEQLAVLASPFARHVLTSRGRKTSIGIGPNGTFSPDGKRIVAPSGRGAVIWDAYTGAQLALLRGHTGEVSGATFSPDSRWVATWASDGVRIWYAESGKEFAHPTQEEPGRVCFSPDSRWLLTYAQRSGTWLWAVDPLAEARTRKSRELTPLERERFEIGSAVGPGPCIDVRPIQPVLHRERAQFLAKAGQWKAAAESYRRALDWDPDDVQSVCELAIVLLAAGDRDGARQLCVTHTRRLMPVATYHEWIWIARCCALVPGVPRDILEAAARVIDADDLRREGSISMERMRVLAWGSILYRLGRHDKSIHWLNKAYPSGMPGASVYLVLAMAHHQLRHAEKTKTFLGRAAEQITRRKDWDWLERVEAQFWRQEAEKLVGR